MALSSDFQIDGNNMPRPHAWQVNPKPISSDSQRLIGNGRAVVPYLTMVYEVVWSYKYLTASEYDVLYAAYITSTVTNKSMYHTLKTLDSNTGQSLELDIYTQSDFQAPLYRISNGVRYYKDVTFTFISLGGEEGETAPSSTSENEEETSGGEE